MKGGIVIGAGIAALMGEISSGRRLANTPIDELGRAGPKANQGSCVALSRFDEVMLVQAALCIGDNRGSALSVERSLMRRRRRPGAPFPRSKARPIIAGHFLHNAGP